MRGRPPKPTYLKVIEGNPGKRPLNHNEPKGRGHIGEPPDDWNDAQAALWREIVAAAPPGVLTGSDRLLVELTARLVAEVRSGGFSAKGVAQLRGCLGEMGMSPSARARLTVPQPPARNPFAEI